MGRQRLISWVYRCDADLCGDSGTPYDERRSLQVIKGQECSTGRGTVVYDQADADAVARGQGWTLGRQVLCPGHAAGGR